MREAFAHTRIARAGLRVVRRARAPRAGAKASPRANTSLGAKASVGAKARATSKAGAKASPRANTSLGAKANVEKRRGQGKVNTSLSATARANEVRAKAMGAKY